MANTASRRLATLATLSSALSFAIHTSSIMNKDRAGAFVKPLVLWCGGFAGHTHVGRAHCGTPYLGGLRTEGGSLRGRIPNNRGIEVCSPAHCACRVVLGFLRSCRSRIEFLKRTSGRAVKSSAVSAARDEGRPCCHRIPTVIHISTHL